MQHGTGTAVLDETARRELRRRVAADGEVQTAIALDVARQTIARALAGLPLRRATAVVLTARLTPPRAA